MRLEREADTELQQLAQEKVHPYSFSLKTEMDYHEVEKKGVGERNIQIQRINNRNYSNKNNEDVLALVNNGHIGIVQGVFTFTTFQVGKDNVIENHQISPDELYENIKGTREAKAFEASGKSLLEYLRQIDGTTFETRNHLLTKIKTDSKRQEKSKLSTSDAEAQPFTYADKIKVINDSKIDFKILNMYLSGNNLVEFEYKLAVLAISRMDIAIRTIELLISVKKNEGIISLDGVKFMIAKNFSSVWSARPSELATQVEGLIILVLGTNAELEALLNAAIIRPEEGEKVISGAKFIDLNPGGEKIEEDVDVSFIDSNGVLNLIEVGFNFNVINNKLAKHRAKGKMEEQIDRYLHFMNVSTELVQMPKEGLRDRMAMDRKINDIKFYYSVPEIEFANEEKRNKNGVLARMSSLGIGLLTGGKRYSSDELRGLINYD